VIVSYGPAKRARSASEGAPAGDKAWVGTHQIPHIPHLPTHPGPTDQFPSSARQTAAQGKGTAHATVPSRQRKPGRSSPPVHTRWPTTKLSGAIHPTASPEERQAGNSKWGRRTRDDRRSTVYNVVRIPATSPAEHQERHKQTPITQFTTPRDAMKAAKWTKHDAPGITRSGARAYWPVSTRQPIP